MCKKISFVQIFWFFFYFFLFCLILRNSLGYLDPDLGWHLKVGQEIAQTRTVPHANHYNYTFTGNWVDHEWLSNYLVYQVYSHFGYLALNIIFALLVILALIMVTVFARIVLAKSPPWGLVAILQVLGITACLPHLGVRIQELALLFLLGLLIIIYYYNRTKDWRYLIVLPFGFYLWANLHASFLIGLFILAAWIGLKLLERLCSAGRLASRLDFSQLLRYPQILNAALFLILSVGATLLTPYRLELYSFLSGYGNTVYFSYIQEWQSQFSFPFQYGQLIYLDLVVLALGLYVYSAWKKQPRPLNLWNFFLVLLFLILGFKSRRHFPLLFISSFIFLLDVYAGFLIAPAKDQKKRPLWLNLYIIFCLVMVTTSQLIQTRLVADPLSLAIRDNKFFCRDYPCGAVEFLKSRPEYLAANIFDYYGWGGFMIWAYPEKKLFIDGRLPQVYFGGHTFLEEYLAFFKKDDEPASQLARYDIKLVLIPTKDPEPKARNWEKLFFSIRNEDLIVKNHLRDYLLSSPDWQRVYYDQTAAIFLKK